MRHKMVGALLLLLGVAITFFAAYGLYITPVVGSGVALAHAGDTTFDLAHWESQWRASSAAHLIAGVGLAIAGVLSLRRLAMSLGIVSAVALFEAVFPWLQQPSVRYPWASASPYVSCALLALAVAAFHLFVTRRRRAGT